MIPSSTHAFRGLRTFRASCSLAPLALSLLFVACDKKETEPAPQPAPTAAPLPSNLPGAAQNAGSHHNPHSGPKAQIPPTTPAVAITWDVPDGWKEMPRRPMRQATYQIDGKKGPAEVAVFYFGPGQGGSVDANITRWVGQFQGLAQGAEKRTKAEVNGLVHHSVSVESGTFASGMPGAPSAPSENFGMRATIVEAEGGQYFFKLTGPAETVKEHADEFAKMLSTVKNKS